MMLRVTLIDSSDASSPYGLAFRLSDSLPWPVRKLKVECFRSLPRPFSGRGPATVSSQSLSSRPMARLSESGHFCGRLARA
uniref:Uncharacterized protein LOC105647487 isoform X1 n=1 Tax=Rhizophora mucronata TaxID=61149 RepID=A0A2P2ITP8_RHIMU